jgi:phosphoribosyl 1,2-cyclic phosphodiesterase
MSESEDYRLRLSFWGVRGSIPTPVRENLRYGGNTSCLEVRLGGGEILVFDAGTGIRALGNSLTSGTPDERLVIHVFFTHFHGDHIHGLPFFAPLNHEHNQVTFRAHRTGVGLFDVLEGHIREPYFPVDFADFPAQRKLIEIDHEPLSIGEATIRPFRLHHPQGATGYRIEVDGAAIVYASDHEHGNPETDAILLEHARDADILVYDAQYTPEDYERHVGWGHSTWLEATKLAREAGVERLLLFHHSPFRDDDSLDEIVREARTHFESTSAAREGSVLTL